jgi:hypothetical protein
MLGAVTPTARPTAIKPNVSATATEMIMNWTALLLVTALIPLLAIGFVVFIVHALDCVVHMDVKRDGKE